MTSQFIIKLPFWAKKTRLGTTHRICRYTPKVDSSQYLTGKEILPFFPSPTKAKMPKALKPIALTRVYHQNFRRAMGIL